MNIMNETTNFVSKYVSIDLFDSMMLQCMKTILSYYEKKIDMIVSDYNYMITMPLIICFAELRWLMSSPAELIGMYFSLIEIIKVFDPFLILKAAQPTDYEFKMVDTMLEYMTEYDSVLADKFHTYCVESNHKKSMGIVVRKFVQSLGFYLLNVDVVLYVWDQIILKTEPQKDEMYYYFIALMISCKDELLQCDKFSDFVETIYMKGKAIQKDLFVAKYIEMIPKMQYFIPRYDYDQVPVEDIRLNKFPMDERVSSKIHRQLEAEKNDLSLDEDEKKVKANMEQLIRDNVVNESNADFPEADGMLVDNSMLNNLNKPNIGDESNNDDILADMLSDKKSSKKSRKSSKRAESKKSKRSKSKKDKKSAKESKRSKSRANKKSKKEPKKKKGKESRSASKAKSKKEKKPKKERTKSKGKSKKSARGKSKSKKK